MLDASIGAFRLLLSGDAALWGIVWLSLTTSVVALMLAAPPAILLGYGIASHRFPARRLVIWLVQASLSLPTVLVGLLLYMLLSRQGPMGFLQWLFTQQGVILGQVIVALPVLVAFTLASQGKAKLRS